MRDDCRFRQQISLAVKQRLAWLKVGARRLQALLQRKFRQQLRGLFGWRVPRVEPEANQVEAELAADGCGGRLPTRSITTLEDEDGRHSAHRARREEVEYLRQTFAHLLGEGQLLPTDSGRVLRAEVGEARVRVREAEQKVCRRGRKREAVSKQVRVVGCVGQVLEQAMAEERRIWQEVSAVALPLGRVVRKNSQREIDGRILPRHVVVQVRIQSFILKVCFRRKRQ